MPRLAVRAALVLTSGALVVSPLLVGPADAAPAKRFANCTAMNKAYPHGVGKPGARDHTSGTPVTSFTRNAALYAANAGSDRDKDGIACEKL